MFRKTLICAAALFTLLAQADTYPTGKLFDLTVGVNSSYNSASDSVSGGTLSAPAGFTSLSSMFDNAKGAGLSGINAAYNDTAASVIRIGFLGMPLVISTTASSTGITFSVPALGLVKVFNAQATRDGNVDDLRAFLKSDGGSILNQLQQALAKFSSNNPVAGNPNSMQSQMAAAEFDRSFSQNASNIISTINQQSANAIGVGASFGRYTQSGINSQSFTLPLSYSFRSDLDPRRQWTLYAPVSMSSVAGSKSYAANFGASYRMPINDEWSLTPGAGYGISASSDMGTAAAMLNASLTSQYTLRKDGYDLSFGNGLTYSQSQKFSAGGYSFNPNIKNTSLRNGAVVSLPTHFMGQKMSYEVSYINTRFFGTELFSNQYNEIGLTLGTNKNADSSRRSLRAGVSYLVGQNGVHGFRLNIGAWF